MGTYKMVLQLSPAPGDPTVTIDPASDSNSIVENTFTAAVTRNNSTTASLAVTSSVSRVTRVILVTTERLSWLVQFYSGSGFGGAGTVAGNLILGSLVLDASMGVQVADQPVAANLFTYDVTCDIPVYDSSGASQLNVLLSPRNGNKAADLRMKIFYTPAA